MRTLSKLYDHLLGGLVVVVCVLIVLAMLFVSIDVVARYFFNRPMAWVFEATEYFMLYVPFLGMAALVRRDGHVKIDLLVGALTPRSRVAFDFATSILCTIACAIVAYYSALSTMSHFRRGVLTYGLYPIPKGWLIAGICLGFTLTTIEFARRAWRRWKEMSGDPALLEAEPPPSTPAL